MRDYEEKSFYEIQLDNKQLILVFLAAITVCVLIFVLGVMIGKGQKEAEIAAAGKADTTTVAAPPDEDLKVPEDLKPNTSSGDPKPKTSVVAVNAKDRNEKKADDKKKADPSKPVEEDISPKPERYAYQDLDKTEDSDSDAETTIKPDPQVTAGRKPTTQESTTAEDVEASTPQYTVQVVATASRGKAEQQMASLRSKGYKPFMDRKPGSSGTVYKVRIGKFTDTASAKKVASRLKQDMRLETWVTVLD